MNKSRLLLVITLLAGVTPFYIFDLGHYFTLEFFKNQKQAIELFYSLHPLVTPLIYFLLYVLVTALSLPGAVLMTLVGGALFGLLWGTVLVSFASSIGAALAFLVSRFVLQKMVQNRFSEKLRAINAGIEEDGAFYLFTLRLVPAFPFFVINLVMGLTTMKVGTFYWISQVGMLAGSLVYVNAGVQIAELTSVSGLLSPQLLISFALLGIFPWIAKGLISALRNKKLYAPYERPARFDRNLIVIGGGSAGLVTAYIAAAVKAKVTLVEKHKMGGDCLNTGCVPSKALIRSAKFLNHARRAEAFGFKSVQVDFDFADVMARVQRVIKTVEPHDSVKRYTELGVECLQGEAHINSPWSVTVNGQTLTTRAIVVATGARPYIPPIPGIEKTGYLTSDTIWNLRQKPERLVVLGGGPIGCELSQTFARLGCQVILVEKDIRLLNREDVEISQKIKERFLKEGMDLRLEHTAQMFLFEDGKKILQCENQGDTILIPFENLLVAVGRSANVQGFGLEAMKIPLTPRQALKSNAYLQTRFPNIFACGDVTGPYQFTHTAAHQAWYAAVNALFGSFKKFRVDYTVIPWCTFTDPEVARVGLNEEEATAQSIPYEVTTFDMDDLDRAIADDEAHGVVKVLTVPGQDRILGVTIVGSHAGEMIVEYVSAMRNGFGLNKILSTIHIYPTFSEANKYAAGNWKKAHQPEGLLEWAQRFHAWRL